MTTAGWLGDTGGGVEAPDGALDAAALRRAAERRAGELAPGDVVAADAAPGLAFVETLHASALAGAVIVPLDPRLAPDERSRRVAARPTRPDTAVIVHTSGTTAEPRPVELTAANWRASAQASRAALGLAEDERWLCAMPLAHVGGLSILTRCALFGWTAVLHERFDPPAVATALRDERITAVSLVPTMLARLLDAGVSEPSHLKVALIGGGPIPPALLDRAREAGIPVAATYGMTEACSQVTTQSPGDDDLTAGRPLPGTDLQIAPDGEILVGGPTVAPGAIAADGWLHTGDLGAIDDGGRLTVTGRKAETIISGGENVSPAEVEAVLEEHEAVAEAAVHGLPDPEWGERIVARVVLRDGAAATAGDLAAHCRERLAAFKVPKAIEFADHLPRTASGKLLRRSPGAGASAGPPG